MTPTPLPTRRADLRLLAIPMGLVALALYAATTAPWLTWAHSGADGGDLIAAAMTGGVPHPSGYPTYCLLGRAFALLPLGTIAHRFNLFSAAAAAAAVALTYLVALTLLARDDIQPRARHAAIACIAALAFAASPAFWAQAIITEVYALAMLFATLCLYQALLRERLERPTAWMLLGLTFGLGLGAHLTLVLLAPALAVLLWPHANRRRGLAGAAGVLLGLSVFAYLPLAAAQDPPVNWGDPRTLAGFWWVISGRLYHHYALGVPLHEIPTRLAAWVGIWSAQYTWPGLFLALMGWWAWFERERRWAAAALLALLAYALYAVTYDTADSHVYLLPTYLLTALWLANGLRALYDLWASRWRPRTLAMLPLILAVALPLWSAAGGLRTVSVRHDRTAADWVEASLGQLPAGALLITGEDGHTFSMDYVQWVEGRRADLLVVDGELLQQDWYAQRLRRREPALQGLSHTPTLEHLVAAVLAERPVYLSTRRQALEDSFEVVSDGSLWRIVAPS